jgi:hypothetical protein
MVFVVVGGVAEHAFIYRSVPSGRKPAGTGLQLLGGRGDTSSHFNRSHFRG